MRTLLKVILWTLGIGGGICLILYLTLFDVWTVPSDDPVLGASIAPTLFPGDLLLVRRSPSQEVGSLVRCPDPDNPGRFLVGRVVGKGGDQLDIHGGAFSSNGHSVSSSTACEQSKVTVHNPVTQEDEELPCSNEEFAGSTHPAIRAGIESTKVTVEPGYVFLLSDNRKLHHDSRDFGQIQPTACQRVAFRLWSSGGYSDSARRFTFIW